MFIMQRAKHSPESCPVYDPKFREMTVNWYENVDALASKYGMKVVGIWNDHPQHEVFAIYETPSMEALMGFMTEPMNQVMLSFNKMEVKPVFSAQETLAAIKH